MNISNESTLFHNEEFNKWDYVHDRRGAQQLPLVMAVPLTVVNVLIFVSGLLGNIAVCIVIIKHRSLHTATNYYLFNLAVSDLTLLIFGLPNDVSIYWHQYPWSLGDSFCKLRALLSEMASYVSVMTIVAFSTERYLAICHPLYLHTMSGLQRAIRIIICLWVVAFCGAFPFSMYTTVDYVFYPNESNETTAGPILESAFCGMTEQPAGVPLAELSTIIFFVIPMLIIAVQYTKMALEISKTTRKTLGNGLKGSVHRDSRRGHSNRSVIRMLSAVVIAFFLCWAPFHAQRLLIIYGDEKDEHFIETSTWMFVVTGIFYYFSSTLNPILYNIMSDRMRNAFKEVLCGYSQQRAAGNLSRTSTIRETYSRTCHVRVQATKTQIETILDDENEDEKTLMGHEQEQCKNLNPLIYMIEYKGNKLANCNKETPI